MAYTAQSIHRSGFDMHQKMHSQPAVARRLSRTQASLETASPEDTDFEEDVSDEGEEEYDGRRSEDSNKKSDTTLSSFDELVTPDNDNYNGYDAFNFRLEESVPMKKPVVGPVGPHLFRMSEESSQNIDFYLSMSPPMSPEEPRAGPTIQARQEPASHSSSRPSSQPLTAVPLHAWTPLQVADWMHQTGFEKSIIEQFLMNDISGSTLIDLKYEDLKELGIASFGHRHRLWNEIRNLKEKMLINAPPTPPEDHCATMENTRAEAPSRGCSSPDSPGEHYMRVPASGKVSKWSRGRGRNDIISPAESASIVAIEQLLPKPHKCSKGENCSKWKKQQQNLARLATEFPIEIQQIEAANNASPVESGVGSQFTGLPSVVASSDLLGQSQLPPVRLEEGALKVVKSRDPQENVRQFLNFQHMNRSEAEAPATPPYEMFPALSPPAQQAPHSNLRSLPKLTIPDEPVESMFSSNRTAVPYQRATPATAINIQDRHSYQNIYRLDSPASDMDIPITAIPSGPIERDVSSSVPPDMRFGHDPSFRSASRDAHRRPRPDFLQQTHQLKTPIQRSTSTAGHRNRPSFAMAPVAENVVSTPIEDVKMDPTVDDIHHEGWMRKRRTKMLRHEWHDNHFRLHGTRLAMHPSDKPSAKTLETIDVDEYAVACSSLNSGKLNAAFKRLQLGKKKEGEGGAYAFQLVPQSEKGLLGGVGKTHHFAVNTGGERCDWMRELMLAKALKKQKGCDVQYSSFE